MPIFTNKIASSTRVGYVGHHSNSSNVGLSWNDIKGASGGNFQRSFDAMYLLIDPAYDSGWLRLGRAIIIFSTSTLPDNIHINSATVRVFYTYKVDDLAYKPSFNIYSATTSDDSFVATDYNNIGDVPFSTEAPYSTPTGSVTFTLNTNGISHISKPYTKFGLKLSETIEPTWITGFPPPVESGFIPVHNVGAAYEPVLTIDYINASEYPTDSLTRVTGVKHIYKNKLVNNGKTEYKLQEFLGGLAYLPSNELEAMFEAADPIITPQGDYNTSRTAGQPIYAPGHLSFGQSAMIQGVAPGYYPGAPNQPFYRRQPAPPPPNPYGSSTPTYDFGENSGRQGL